MSGTVKIVEVGLRDGLQNETTNLNLEQRLSLLKKLIDAGVQFFEVGAYVSPKWVPQMAITDKLVSAYFSQLHKAQTKSIKLRPSVLVPNEQGMQSALNSQVKEIALFASSSESFSQKNINCSIEESFERFTAVMRLAKKNKIKVRGYLSVCFGCPFEGAVAEKKVVQLAKRLIELGCYEVSIGDTIGVASVGQVQSLFKKLKKEIPLKKLAGHFHDTRGQALVNILAAYELGVRTFDSSIGGLGGCPYAKGATGNVATEDVVYMFDNMKVKTGLKLEKLIQTSQWLAPLINHPLSSKVGKVGLLKV